MNFEQIIKVIYVPLNQTPSNYINERQLLGWELVSSSSINEDGRSKFTLTFKRSKNLKTYYRFKDLNMKIDFIDNVRREIVAESVEKRLKKETNIEVQGNLALLVMVILIFVDIFFIAGIFIADITGFKDIFNIFINALFVVGLNVGFVFWFKYLIREKKKSKNDPIIDDLNLKRSYFIDEAKKLNFEKK